ncbi:unnamed protein product [Paramecium sonneborni]|uniref:Aminopeptidase n=1 Tax=Paramecium sonneborni TaxID=65129 RepID=A0A8S1KHM1_9CILI|nr:unnamed protein product [Paramecium sonneborni]
MIRLLQQQQQFRNQVRYSLTHSEAKLRKSLFNNFPIETTMYIELLKGQKYRGIASMSFDLKEAKSLFLDCQGQDVSSLIVNNQSLQNIKQDGNKLWIESGLKKDLNRIEVYFQNQYSTTGHGLHSFMDHEDQYVYSQCEPHHASKMFPCFDQPDLKGTFKLFAYAPREWKVISNERYLENPKIPQFIYEKGYFPNDSQYKIWEFDKTKPLSTYLYAILAGPYVEIKAPEELLHNSIPQSLYCRKSLLKFVMNDAYSIFKVTSDSMKFFDDLFQYKYPFGKYDQIFCPEYSTGAMENAGAVTINDLYVFKEPVPKSQIASRANTIIHELSHMWFGDLVTMEWWDDLWLNESFAEFIAHLCQDNVCQGEKVNYWVQFLERKLWGYVTDEKSTTHPIYCQIDNTDQAENIFDGITYAKGAALIKQIYFTMGREGFSKAMGLYFQKHAYGNTKLSDFFKSMSINKNVNWEEFKQEWIMTSGFNILSYTSENNQIIIKQTGSYLRKHSLTIGQFNNNEWVISKIEVDAKEITTIKLDGLKQNTLLILNYNDENYIKVSYNKEQTQMLLQNLSTINNSLNRLLVLQSIFDQVRDGQTCFLDFQQGVSNFLKHESDDTVVKIVLNWCAAGVNNYTPYKYRASIRENLANTVKQLIDCTQEQSKLLTLRSHYINWSRTIERLSSINIDEIGVKDGWIYIYNQFLYNQPSWNLFDNLALKDVDNKKHKRFLESLTIDKDQLWSYFINFDKHESVQQVSQVMRAFNHEKFIDQLGKYESRFFDIIVQVFETKESEYAKAFFNNLYPVGENLELYQLLSKEALAKTKNDFLIKLLKESIDINDKRIKAYKTFK